VLLDVRGRCGMSVPAQYVYLIGGDASPLVKIGTTNNVASRLRSIQNMSPTPLRVLWHTEGGFGLEQALHDRFRKYRKHGEWFDFGNRNPVTAVSKAAAGLAHLVRDPKSAPRSAPTEPETPHGGCVTRNARPRYQPVPISREFLLDDRMSGFARGIGAYLLARTDVPTVAQLAEANGCSPDAVEAAVNELTELDYLCIADGALYFDGWPSPMERAQGGAQ